jgi:hypothetical protein
MAYIDQEYYTNTFGGIAIPATDFPALARTASDIIDAAAMRPIVDATDENVKKATAYQTEYLFQQGGTDAYTGFAAAANVENEKLGDYSITAQQTQAAQEAGSSIGGIPVSPLAIATLRKGGYMNRWAYAGEANRDAD